MGANGASCQELQRAPKIRFRTNFFWQNYGLIARLITSYFHPRNLPVLHEIYWVYYSYIQFKKFGCRIFDLERKNRGWIRHIFLKKLIRAMFFVAYWHSWQDASTGPTWSFCKWNKYMYFFLVDLVAHFLKLYVDCMRKWSVAMKIEPSEIGF
jgi:hypothetical protein